MAKNKSSRNYPTWLFMFSTGVVLVFTGIAALIQPWPTYVEIVRYSGYGLILIAILILVHIAAIKSSPGENKWLIAEIILDLVFGLTLILNPFLAIIAFPTVIGSWILARGILKILIAVNLKNMLKGWLFILVAGIMSALFGLLIITDPFRTVTGTIISVSVFSLMMGCLYIYDSLRLRKLEDTVIALL